MSRPDSEHVISLRNFRERLVGARRAAASMHILEQAIPRFTEIATAIALVDKAIENEMDLTPLPRVDDPTRTPPKI